MKTEIEEDYPVQSNHNQSPPLAFETRSIHGSTEKNPFGALATPIFATSTFVFDTAEQGGARFAGQETGYIYGRLGNPTVSQLEQTIADLEDGEAGLALASGMGAISTVCYTALKAKDHILADETLYGCTFAFFAHGLTRFDVEVTFVDFGSEDAVQEAIRPNTKVIYFETPANPNCKLIDIAKIATMAHDYNPSILVVCDNTFATPYLQRPLALGCDVVVHSATKYLNGHGDVIAGLAVGTAAFIQECRYFGLKDMTGAVLSPFDAFLILRGIKTLSLRMQRHCDNAMKIANYLQTKQEVSSVHYPGLVEFPNHRIAIKQMAYGFGGVLGFALSGGYWEAVQFINHVKLCKIAVSLGDCETLIQHPASMTHSPYTKEERERVHITDGLIRMSIGLEAVEDIIADLEQAFQMSKTTAVPSL